jgi:3-oxoadipate enol-lactonase
MTESRNVMVPGAPQIAIEHIGAGPLAIFLHGIGLNRTNWQDQLPVFARDFHAAAWDARGYSDSDDYEGPLDFGDFAHDLRRVLDHFGATRAHLVGLSMGGMIALDFTTRYGDRVATLTLCDSLPGFTHLTEDQRREFIRLREEPLLAGKEPRDMAPAVARSLLGKNPRAGSYERVVESMSVPQAVLPQNDRRCGESRAKARTRKHRRSNPRCGRRSGYVDAALDVARAGAPHPGRSPHDH